MSDEKTKVDDSESTAPWWGADDAGGFGDADMTPDPSSGSGKSIRFWMPKGTERRIIFLSDGNGPYKFPPPLWEHQVKLGGNWQNWFSCLEPLGMECPLCKFSMEHKDGMGRRYKGVFISIIDTHEFEDKAGRKRKNLKKLMVAKKDTVEILKRRYLARLEQEPPEGLRGAMFRVYRKESDTSASVGDDFEFIKMVDLESLPDTEPFDVAELTRPDPDAVAKVYATLTGGSVAAEGTDASVSY